MYIYIYIDVCTQALCTPSPCVHDDESVRPQFAWGRGAGVYSAGNNYGCSVAATYKVGASVAHFGRMARGAQSTVVQPASSPRGLVSGGVSCARGFLATTRDFIRDLASPGRRHSSWTRKAKYGAAGRGPLTLARGPCSTRRRCPTARLRTSSLAPSKSAPSSATRSPPTKCRTGRPASHMLFAHLLT